MNENPLVKQDPLSGARLEEGRAGDRGTALIPVIPNVVRTGLKQPRFAITPGKMCQAVLHRWKLAVIVGFLCAGAGAGLAWVTYKPSYTATTMMRMESSESHLLPGPDDGRNQRGEEFRKTQAHIIKSREVLGAVLKKDQIRGLNSVRKAESPIMWLEKELQAGFIPGTNIIHISLSGEDPEEVALLVNAVKDVYLDQFVNAAKKQQAAQIDNIEKVLSDKEEKIRAQRQLLKSLAETYKTGDTQVLTLKQRMALEEFGEMKREFSKIEAENRRLVAELSVQRSALKAQADEKPPQAVLDDYLDRNPAVQKQQHEIDRVEAQIQEYGKLVTGSSPRLAQLQEELKAANSQLRKLKTDLEPEVKKKISAEIRRRRLNAMEQTEEKLKILQEQRTTVGAEVSRLGREADKIGIGSFEMEVRRGEIEASEAYLNKLRAEKERLDVEKFNNRESVTGMQPAEVPTINQASLLRSGIVDSIAGLLLGLFGVSYFEARVRRVHQAVEVHQELGIDTLGVLPLLAQQKSLAYGITRKGTAQTPRNLFTEAINGVCATIMCDDRLSLHAVIMVTSASEHEGKTLLATQLAAGFARNGRKTLLLDCDFRNPRCHQQLGIPAGQGISEVLRGEVDLAAALHSMPESDAQVLTAGQSDPQVIQSLTNGKFAALLARLREAFDCIIVDSAPTLVVPDGLMIGKLVDGVILVVRPKISKAPIVFSAYEQLTGLNIRILGAVINGHSSQMASSYYHR